MDTITKKIIDHSVEYAKNLLMDTGQCYPFGAFVDNAEIVHPLEFEITDKKNIPNNESVIWSLHKFCESEMKAGKIIAFGLTYEASVQLEVDKPSIDTIIIDIVDRYDSDIPFFHYPFEKMDDSTINFGEPFAVKR